MVSRIELPISLPYAVDRNTHAISKKITQPIKNAFTLSPPPLLRLIKIRAIIGAVTTMITIYKITNRLNRKIYVGQTRQSIEKRFIQHSKTDSPLGQAMQDCGLENFTIEIIEECETQDQANERERFLINVLKSKLPNGYNRSNGGEGGIHKSRIISLNKEVFVMAIGDNKSSPKAWAFTTGTCQRCGRF